MRNVIDVPYLDQSVRYPTGCESVSAVMLLRYLGYEMSVDEFIEQYLDRQEFEFREGELTATVGRPKRRREPRLTSRAGAIPQIAIRGSLATAIPLTLA